MLDLKHYDEVFDSPIYRRPLLPNWASLTITVAFLISVFCHLFYLGSQTYKYEQALLEMKTEAQPLGVGIDPETTPLPSFIQD